MKVAEWIAVGLVGWVLADSLERAGTAGDELQATERKPSLVVAGEKWGEWIESDTYETAER